MNIDFKDKKVLVKGSTIGIGFAVANGFLASGAEVVINGRTGEDIASALRRLDAGTKVSGFAGDLGIADDCDRLVDRHPSFDIVVNNIGIYGSKDFFETPDSEWKRFFQTNVMSGVRISRAYAPGMVERGWGRIVFVSSESALNIPADMIHYGFTKTSQLAISRGLAKRLAGTDVTVNSVLPGPTLSEGESTMLQSEVDRTGDTLDEVAINFIKAHRSSSIIQRAASVEEIANMILYVSSQQASATTGAALRVDGGVVETIA